MNRAFPELTVTIINYRTPDMTIRCACSVLNDMVEISGQVVIVDNCSGDDSVDRIATWIRSLPPGTPVKLLHSRANSGFSAGHNQGIAAYPAQFHLILNSDALLRPGCLGALLRAARMDSGAGLVTPRLEGQDSRPQVSHFRFFTPLSELIRGAATGPITRLLHRHDVPIADATAADQIFWASFACILLRREMIEDLGPLDEGYFLYFEDSAYCWHARRAGWRIAHAADARVVHLRGGSAPVKQLAAAGRRLPRYYYASRTRFLYQAHGWPGLLAANLCWHLGRSIAATRGLLGKPVPSALEREARDIWTNFLDPLGDRLAPRD